jgi:hypothetical protein
MTEQPIKRGQAAKGIAAAKTAVASKEFVVITAHITRAGQLKMQIHPWQFNSENASRLLELFRQALQPDETSPQHR